MNRVVLILPALAALLARVLTGPHPIDDAYITFRYARNLAEGLGLMLEQSYRLLRGLSGFTISPLLSRQAVHVLGRDQDFSNEKARAVLGWEPRVGYADGLAATLAWLEEPRA